jgi:signal transduction histidine kinase
MTTTPALRPKEGYAARWPRALTSPGRRTWLLYFPLCAVTGALAISTWDVRVHGAGVEENVSNIAAGLWLVALLVAATLYWRRRFPVAVAVGTAVAALLLPLDPTAALIAFGSLTVRRLDRVTGALGALVLVVTTWSIWRDGRGLTKASSFWQMVARSSPDTQARHEPLGLWVTLAIAGVLVIATFGLGMILRDRHQARLRRQTDAAQSQVVTTLADEVARQAERERLAQEVHDALGHRLSLLSLHAGALELAAGNDPTAAESAALVRANAQQSMADLRSLLDMLRRPESPDVAAAVPTIADVPALVDDAVTTGSALVSTVQLESVERLDPATSRSAYRVVQELLTNARRHAPGVGVRLLLRATPAEGVIIEVANHLPRGAGEGSSPAGVTPGSGLTGIRTRVEQLGGDWRCWVDEGRVFRGAAHLPWVWAAAVDAGRPGDAGRPVDAGSRGDVGATWPAPTRESGASGEPTIAGHVGTEGQTP